MIFRLPFKKLFLGILFLSLSNFELSSKAIFFDIGYTAFEPDKLSLSNEIGALDFVSYAFWDGRGSDDIKNCLLDIFSLMGTQEGAPEELVCSSDGQPMGAILVDWQTGKKPPSEIYTEALERVEELKEEKYFCSKCEYRLVKNSLRVMLDPKILANSMRPITKAIKLAQEFYEAVDAQGKPKNQTFVLSNFEAEAFDLMYQEPNNQKFFQYFDEKNIIVSGKIGLIKPHKDIFKYILKTYNLKAEDCVLIDDQLENVLAARACGFTAFHLKDLNYKKLREELKKADIL